MRTDTNCESNRPFLVTMAFTPSPLVLVSSFSSDNESMSVAPLVEANDTFPSDLRFNENSLTVVIVYCVLFVIAAVGNLTVFITLFKSRHRKSRISLMITHLAVADLLVTFIMIPLEVRANVLFITNFPGKILKGRFDTDLVIHFFLSCMQPA